MAKIGAPIAQEIRDTFRGTLDFSCWRGIHYVRKWPTRVEMPRSPNVQASANKFGYVSKQASEIDPDIQQAYQDLVGTLPSSWKDFMTAFYIHGTEVLEARKI